MPSRGVAWTPADAREQAMREFGDVDDARRYLNTLDRHTEAARRRRDYVGEFRQDLVYALAHPEVLARVHHHGDSHPRLGIGANTAIFSVVDGVLLRPLPFPRAGQLVKVWSAGTTPATQQTGVSVLDLDDWRAQKRSLTDIGGWFYQRDGGSGIDLTSQGEPQRLGSVFFTPGFLGALGVAPEQGRLPREDEMRRGGDDRVVLLSCTDSGCASSAGSAR